MPLGVRKSKRPSRFQQRKGKQARKKPLKMLAGAMFPSARILGDGQGSSEDAVHCKADSSSGAGMHSMEEPGVSVAKVKVEEEMAESESEESPEGQLSEDQWTDAQWKDALRGFVDYILFQIEQNAASVDDEEDESSVNNRNFLKVAEKLSRLNPAMGMLIMSIKQMAEDFYLSPENQKEFLNAIGDHMKEALVKDIKSAGYFGILFDTTSDSSFIDQVSEVIRYVKINNGKVKVKEAFLGLFPVCGGEAADLGSAILKHLEGHGLDIMRCRAQGYGSATLMAGIHGGVRAILEGKNKKAIFNGFVDPSLTLCGWNCFRRNSEFAGCSVILEDLFSLFASSTCQWDVLIAHTGASMERLPTTRWGAHYAAVKLVREKFDEVVAALEAIRDSPPGEDPRTNATGLFFQVCDFSFLCFVNVWCDVLREASCTQQYLQNKSLTLTKVVTAIEALRLFLQEERGRLAERAVQLAVLKADEYDIPVERRFESKKFRAHDPELTAQDAMKRAMFECIDRFDSELQIRSRGIKEVSGTFEAVQVESLLSASEEELKVSIPKLATFYDEISESGLLEEIRQLRRHLSAAEIDLKEAKCWGALDVLTHVAEWNFIEFYPNLSLSLKLFLTICVSVVSCERNYSKLKCIKDYLQSPLAQLNIPGLAMLFIENDLAQDLSFDELIDRLATLKAMEGLR